LNIVLAETTVTTHKRFERPSRMHARTHPPTSDAAERPHPMVAAALEAVIPVAREELEVGKRRVETDSGVRVHNTVREREAVVDQPLARDEVRVERVNVNRPVDGPVDVRYEGDTMIIPVLEEVLVVQKRLVLKEELHVTRRRSEVRSPQRVTLRSEQAVVERLGREQMPAADETGFADNREATSRPAEPSPAEPAAIEAQEDDSLIERKRRQTQMRRGRLAKTLLPY
jgi:uncharacterized protein (TIGR02271 family)